MKHSLEVTRTVIGAVGNLVSIYLYSSPLPTFIKICKQKTVDEFKPDPYLATMMSCMLWVFYGLPFVHPKNILVTSTNSAGVAIQIAFLTIYCIYADKRNRIKVLLWVAVELAIVATVVVVTLVCFHTTHKRSFFVGIFCAVFCIGSYSAPLTIMRKVIKTKSVEYMPFWLSLGMFANGVVWTVYAVLPYDPWISIPNGVGAISGAAQLILYACYYKSSRKQEEAHNTDPNQTQMPAQSRLPL